MKISVIVPVYNSEKYLHKCIDSVRNQTYLDFELLLINDGSTDRSGEICDEYAVKDKRVKVFHKENGGVSSARNIGLDNAKGKYIVFVDSDDWIEETYLENFFILDKDLETALVLQGFIRELKNGDFRKHLLPNRVFYAKEYSELFYSIKLIRKWPFIASKLFSSEIIKNNFIRFDEDITYGEDLLFILDYLLFSEKVILVNNANYYYTYQEGSLSRFYYPYESENKRLESIIAKLNKLDAKFKFNDKTNKLHKCFFAIYLFRVMQSVYLSSDKKRRRERVQLLKKHNSEEFREWFKIWKPSNSRHMKIVRFLFLSQLINTLDSYYVLYTKANKLLRKS